MVPRIVPALLIILLWHLSGQASAYEVVDVRDGGTLAGRVTFVGPIPDLPPLVISKDHEACAAAATPEMLLVSADHGVANTVVALEGVTRGKAPPAHKPTLDNRHCRMVPRVQAVVVGTEIVVHNSDPFLHTTRGRLPDFKQAFNLVFPKATPAKEQRIRFPGVITVTCDTHAHMRAYIHAFEHPYFAVSDADGRFEIAQVPPGTYTLSAWHEGWRILEYDHDGRPRFEEPYVLSTQVIVQPGATSAVEIQLAARP
jgi:hypothetical protein